MNSKPLILSMEEEEDPVNLYTLTHVQRIVAEEEDDGGQEQQQTQDSPSSDLFMVGFVIVNIVGLQHYSGTISGREMVGLVREPLNPYDSNAIKVLNTRTIQVGHIERSSAAVLAPLIDQRLITVEGIVPNTPNRRNRYKLPCQIHIFASLDATPTVRFAISDSGLSLYANPDPAFALSESVIVKERNSKKERVAVDEIFALVGTEEDNGGRRKISEPPKNVIKTELLLHQKEGLWWLIHRENSCELPPFWKEDDGVYVNVLTNYQTDKRPEPVRGGIFSDEMGLGKTLTLLSLIAANKDDNVGNLVVEGKKISKSVGKKSKMVKSGRKIVSSSKKRKLNDESLVNGKKGRSTGIMYETHDVVVLKTTLIVCPPSVISTWITQLGEHTKPGHLKVYLYHGERTNKVEELLKYDIVLTTYSTLAAEHGWAESPIQKIEWFRVILDEAHLIKNVAAKQSAAVIALKANRRWAVTGTPIQNGSLDLFSLMVFLNFQPFSSKSYWQSLVQRPLDQGSQSGLSRLQALMRTISLRRTKERSSVGLPPKTIETCYIELSVEERAVYEEMESEAKNAIREYIHANSIMRNYTTVLHIILRLRQICNDVALCPSDVRSLLQSSNLEDVSNNPALLAKMISMLQDGDDFDCPICLSPPAVTIITCCAHIFCRSCILRTLKNLNPRCPICRHPLSDSDLYSAPPKPPTDDDPVMSSQRTISSKVSALLRLLATSKAEDASTKSVVFSQFTKMLLLLQKPLEAAGFKILRLDGSMTAQKRAQVIKEFGETGVGAPTVLLASLKAAGTGINLTVASKVYLLEPWWNPAVEEQAMDRVHRIGQRKEVMVVRMIARNTIEERVLQLQERKKTLASAAFGKKSGKVQKEIHIEDLRTLVAL